GVGGEALVHQAQRAEALRIGEIAVEAGDLGRQQQTFIDNGAAAQRRNVEEALVADVGLDDLALGALADDVQLALELVVIHPRGAADKNLLDVRLRDAGDAADGVDVERGIAPAEQAQAFLADDALHDALALQALLRLNGQENEAGAIFVPGGQAEAELQALTGEKFMGNLDQHAGAIAGFRIAAASPAVGQIDEDLDAFGDDIVGPLAVNIHDEADAAGVVLQAGVVQPGRRG